MTITPPLSWVQQIHEDISLCKQIPLWGSCPLFPWKSLQEALQKTLEIPDITLTPHPCSLLQPGEFLTPFGAHPKILFLQLSPLSGLLAFVISEESMQMLTHLMLTDTKVKGLSDPKLQEGFYRFLLLQTSLEIEKLKVYPDLHIQWMEEGSLPSSASLSLDVTWQVQGESFMGRLITSPEFHASFSQHFVKSATSAVPSNLHNILEVCTLLEIGSCMLTQNDWSSLHVGDLLLLDRYSYDPISQSGTAAMTFAEKPCFILKIKKNNLKILDYAVYQGDTYIMDADNLPDQPMSHDLPQEEEEELPPPKESTAPASPPPETLTSPGQIPFPIVVEVERMKMPLEKLLALTPGNILEMSIRPEQGVYLTVHGRRIARGELIKVGDVLGVKILEMGEPASL